jgi:hypothetical protein
MEMQSNLPEPSSNPSPEEVLRRIRSREPQRAALLKRFQAVEVGWASDKTMKTYLPRIKEYLEYCDELDQEYAIDQRSLEMFMHSRVVGRRMRVKAPNVELVGLATVNGYINSLIKLWDIQV